jgi:hypothetical protein
MGFLLALTPGITRGIAYPLPRHRLAWLNFVLCARQAGIGVALQVCGLLGIVGFASFLAGTPFRMENVRVQAAMIFLQLPIVPLIQMTTLVKPRLLGLLGFGLLFALFFASIGVAAAFSNFLSWPAAGASLIATAFSVWLHWRVLSRRYATSDLNESIGLIQNPGTA